MRTGNPFKAAILAGQTQLGIWSSLASNYSLEVVAGAGYDWVLIDTEHSPADLENVLCQLQAIAPYPTAPVVRVAWNDSVTIKRYLDIGARSLLIPFVQNAQEASEAVANTRYPPHGVRGVALTTRATSFGRLPDYPQQAIADTCVIVQVETVRGLDNLEEIAAVEGIDAIFIGPADLHASVGYIGDTNHPDVVPLIENGLVRITRTGRAAGILASSAESAKRWLELGALIVAIGSDVSILARGSERLLDEVQTTSDAVE